MNFAKLIHPKLIPQKPIPWNIMQSVQTRGNIIFCTSTRNGRIWIKHYNTSCHLISSLKTSILSKFKICIQSNFYIIVRMYVVRIIYLHPKNMVNLNKLRIFLPPHNKAAFCILGSYLKWFFIMFWILQFNSSLKYFIEHDWPAPTWYEIPMEFGSWTPKTNSKSHTPKYIFQNVNNWALFNLT